LAQVGCWAGGMDARAELVAELRQVLAHADAAEKRGDAERLAVLRAAFDLSEYAEVATWARRFRPRMSSEAAADECQLIELCSLFFRGAKQALRQKASAGASAEPRLSDRVVPALLYDLEDDNGAYEEGRAVLAAWPGPHWAETRLEPGKAKCLLYAVTVRSWLRVHPPGLQHAAADLAQAQELLAAWEKECATPQQHLEHAVTMVRVQKVASFPGDLASVAADVEQHRASLPPAEVPHLLAQLAPQKRVQYFIDATHVRNWTAMMNSLGDKANATPIALPPSCRLNPHPTPGVIFVTNREVREGEEIGFDYGADFFDKYTAYVCPTRPTWHAGSILVDGVVPAPTVEDGLKTASFAAKVAQSVGGDAQVPPYIRVQRCPASHPAAPGFMVVAAETLPAGTLIGRYAGLLRPGSAADFGTGMYRFDLPEKFNPKELRRFADLVAADWTAAEPSVSAPPRDPPPPRTPEKNKKPSVRVPPKTPETPAKKKLVAGGLNTPALTPKVTKKAIKKGK